MKYYSAVTKNEILPFTTTWMDPEGIILRNKSVREGQILYDFTYMCNLQNAKQKNKQNKSKLIETEINLMVAKGKGCGVMGEKGEGVNNSNIVITLHGDR